MFQQRIQICKGKVLSIIHHWENANLTTVENITHIFE